MRQNQAQATVTAMRGARSGPSAKKMAPQEQRTLQNWLSTRVETRGSEVVVAPDHAYEQVLVASRLAKARTLGLTVIPGGYIPPPPSPASKSRKRDDGGKKSDPPAHLIHCFSCALSYRASHYHCCACQQIFRTAHSFEVHGRGSAGRCATPEQLRRRHLQVVDGVWRSEAPRTLAG